ncbi:MAG: 50S ribosomal protein L28 [bacterium]
MSRRCPLCGKQSMLRTKWKKVHSAYNPVARTRKYPNLQWTILPNGKRIKACTKCLRTLNKNTTKSKKTK